MLPFLLQEFRSKQSNSYCFAFSISQYINDTYQYGSYKYFRILQQLKLVMIFEDTNMLNFQTLTIPASICNTSTDSETKPAGEIIDVVGSPGAHNVTI